MPWRLPVATVFAFPSLMLCIILSAIPLFSPPRGQHSDNSMDTLRIGLISVSDRAANGIYQDQGIPALESWLSAALATPFEIETRRFRMNSR